MVDRWECDCAPPTVLTAHYLKAVRASDYDAMTRDRDQISLALAVAKADRDKWFNRARDLEAALHKHGSHTEDCQWLVFPPGSRDCTCGYDALLTSPETGAAK